MEKVITNPKTEIKLNTTNDNYELSDNVKICICNTSPEAYNNLIIIDLFILIFLFLNGKV